HIPLPPWLAARAARQLSFSGCFWDRIFPVTHLFVTASLKASTGSSRSSQAPQRTAVHLFLCKSLLPYITLFGWQIPHRDR
ncbi:hypothetical protein B0H15DRAFT_936757, partial [Mycena belliarum]